MKYVFKPHTAEVTALAYERDGEILATGVSVRFSLISYWNSMPSFPFQSTYFIVPSYPLNANHNKSLPQIQETTL